MALPTKKPLFSFRIEEFLPIGRFVLQAFNDDKADFKPYKDFDDPFPANYQKALDSVNLTVFPITITNQLELVTKRLYDNTFLIRPIVDSLQNYVINAAADNTLNVLPDDFGISQVRKSITSGDVEGLDAHLKTLDQTITSNLTALQAKGFDKTNQTKLQTIKKSIADDNLLQQKLLTDRSKLASSNMTLLNDTYSKYINKVVINAKNIYRNTDPNRLPDYTYAALLKRIRNDQLKTLVEGKVTDTNGNPLKGVQIIFIPNNGGRKRKFTTDAQGNYKAAGITPTSYTVIASTKVLSHSETLTLAPAEHKTLDITLS